MFGFGGGSGGAQETTRATATLRSQGARCIYTREIGQNANFHGSSVVAPNCSILLNGSANFSGSAVNAAGIGEYDYAGRLQTVTERVANRTLLAAAKSQRDR
jgi:hypothetical protein